MKFITQFFTAESLQRMQSNRVLILLARLLQVAFVVGVLVFLVRKLSDLGWDEVWAALPTSPLYYLFFLAWFVSIPVAELHVYRLIWGFSLSKDFGAFLRKRVYNLAILGYSGEAYLAVWARRHLPLRGRVIFSTIKDSNILSGLASNCLTVIFLLLFLATGQMESLIEVDPNFRVYLGFAALVGILLVPMVLRFRNSILALSPELTLRVFGIHVARNIAMLAFQLGMWKVALPEIPVLAWLLFLTAQLVLTRIPFLPNTDLIYLGLGLTLAQYLDAPEAVVAGMFLASGALSQILNFVLYVATSIRAFNQGSRAIDLAPGVSGREAKAGGALKS